MAGHGARTLKCQMLMWPNGKKVHFKTATISQGQGLRWLLARASRHPRHPEGSPGTGAPSVRVRVTALERRSPLWGTRGYELAGRRLATSQQSSNCPPSWPALCPASPKGPTCQGMFWTSSQPPTPCRGPALPRHPLGGEEFDSMSWLSLNPPPDPSSVSLTSLRPSSNGPHQLRACTARGPLVARGKFCRPLLHVCLSE